MEELTRSSPAESVMPEAVSEALGIGLSKVLDLYFGGIDKVRRGRIIEEAIERH
jgi:hypothetical protein